MFTRAMLPARGKDKPRPLDAALLPNNAIDPEGWRNCQPSCLAASNPRFRKKKRGIEVSTVFPCRYCAN